jgi:hypothetical protein
MLFFIILPPILISLTTLFAALSSIFRSRAALEMENPDSARSRRRASAVREKTPEINPHSEDQSSSSRLVGMRLIELLQSGPGVEPNRGESRAARLGRPPLAVDVGRVRELRAASLGRR